MKYFLLIPTVSFDLVLRRHLTIFELHISKFYFWTGLIIVFLYFITPISTLNAGEDNLRIETITVENGLHQNLVDGGIIQDSLGFIWIGSWGLQRHDGFSFIPYYHNPADDSSLRSNFVFGLFSDRQNNLWISTTGGLQRYQYQTDNFKNYYFVNEKQDTIPYDVYSLNNDSFGSLYAAINFAPDSLYINNDYILDEDYMPTGIYHFNWLKSEFTSLEFVNKTLSTFSTKNILNDENQDGIYETILYFPAQYYNETLEYKFVIVRNDKTIEWETYPNPDAGDYGNRHLKLDHDFLDLPVVAFNVNVIETNIKYSSETDRKKSIKVHFRVNLKNMNNPLKKGDIVELRGSLYPLHWEPRIGINKIYDMAFDKNDMLWVAVRENGVFLFDLLNNSYKHFFPSATKPNTISHRAVNDIFVDRDGDIWLSTYYGLNKYNPENNSFIRYLNNPLFSNSLLNNNVLKVVENQKGELWISYISDNSGISKFNKRSEEFTHYTEVFKNSRSLFIDSSDVIWLGSENRGINKIIRDPEKFNAHTIFKDEKNLLSDYTIFSLFEDSKENTWFSVYPKGLFKYNRKSKQYMFYEAGINNPDGPSSGWIRNFYEDKYKYIWFCAYNALNRFEPKTNKFEQYQTNLSYPYPFPYENLSGMSVIDEIFWIITPERGDLVRFDPTSGNIKNFHLGEQMNDITSDLNGVLWIITKSGVHKFDPDKGKFKSIHKFETKTPSFYRLNIITGASSVWYTCINGLMSYDPETGIKKLISEKDGLLSNTITAIEIDNHSNLWLSSKFGLTKYNPLKKTFKHYFKEDGFNTNDFNFWSHFKNKKSEIYFGSSDGFIVFHPDSIKDSDNIPPVVLTEIKIYNKTINMAKDPQFKRSIFTAEKISLNHDQNDISLTFSALDYTLPARNRYTFILENYDDHWRAPGKDRTAVYTNLDPGEYIFKVKGTNFDGVWNEEPKTLKITILPPWWKTWWSYSFYVLFFVGLIYSLRKYELNRQQLKHNFEFEHMEAEKLKEVNNMKSRFFASISHEFRTPLTLISGPVERLLKQINNKKQVSDLSRIQDNAIRMNKLVEMYLELSRLESGNLRLQKEEQNLVPLLNSIQASFESMADAKEIKLQFKTSVFSAICSVDIEKFELIIINLLSNAIKFTPQNGSITLSVETSEKQNELLIKVEDTGIGIPQNQLTSIFDMYYQVENEINKRISGTGIGLTMAKELIQLHAGKIEVESIQGRGATFKISIPVIAVSEISVKQKPERAGQSKGFDLLKSDNIIVDKDKSKKLILVVEDNHQMRDYIKSHLEEEYETELAANGEEGFARAIKTSPVLIISDVMMPEMDGYEFCTKIKNDFRTSHIPVILLTAKIEEQDMINGLATGADNYLKKPFKAAELHVRIKNLIENRNRLHRKFQTEQHMDFKEFKVTSADELFLEKCLNIIDSNLSNYDFSVEDFANEMALSRIHLYRKLKALTGLSTNKYIQTIRLKKAAVLLVSGYGNISQVAYDCGFSNPSYFAETFKEMFNISPTEYVKQAKNVT